MGGNLEQMSILSAKDLLWGKGIAILRVGAAEEGPRIAFDE